MADYPISDVARRIVYTGSAGVGPYAFEFEVLDDTDINVYKDDVLLVLTTDYTVSISPTLGTGSVTLVEAATGDNRITIVGARPVERTTDFTTGGDFFANTLNDEMDSQTILVQQVAESAERSIKAPVTDPTTINMVLPINTARAGKTLAFDANGNPVAGDPIGNWRGDWAAGVSYQNRDLIKDTTTDNVYITTVAHISSGLLPITTNVDSDKWTLVIDAEAAGTAMIAAEAAQAAAETAQTAAETAQTAAELAETNAETAETNAGNSAASALASIESFNQVYLGAQASDPTLDNNGDPITAGDWYFNTVSNRSRVYDGSTWNFVTVDGSTVVAKTSATGSAEIPNGTTAERDGSPLTGYFRFNTTTGQFEGYNGSAWGSVGGGATGAGGDAVFVENDQTVTTSYTISTNKSASSVGPITISSGVTVTVPSGSRWVVL